jgi:hypothetical protein
VGTERQHRLFALNMMFSKVFAAVALACTIVPTSARWTGNVMFVNLMSNYSIDFLVSVHSVLLLSAWEPARLRQYHSWEHNRLSLRSGLLNSTVACPIYHCATQSIRSAYPFPLRECEQPPTCSSREQMWRPPPGGLERRARLFGTPVRIPMDSPLTTSHHAPLSVRGVLSSALTNLSVSLSRTYTFPLLVPHHLAALLCRGPQRAKRHFHHPRVPTKGTQNARSLAILHGYRRHRLGLRWLLLVVDPRCPKGQGM